MRPVPMRFSEVNHINTNAYDGRREIKTHLVRSLWVSFDADRMQGLQIEYYPEHRRLLGFRYDVDLDVSERSAPGRHGNEIRSIHYAEEEVICQASTEEIFAPLEN